MIVIVNYGLGNLGSIKNMLRKLGHASEISSDPLLIQNATKLILPGVGAFDTGMINLSKLGLIEILNHKVLIEKTPVLGICLGAQLMTRRSEEGVLEGLKWFDAELLSFKKRFPIGQVQPVPNMGWIDVQVKKASKILENLPNESRFYFVHSFFIKSYEQKDILLESNYGFNYVSALERENMIGVQFHPEKSHKFGFQLLKNFVEQY
jgi:glutamine amidotransferase